MVNTEKMAIWLSLALGAAIFGSLGYFVVAGLTMDHAGHGVSQAEARRQLAAIEQAVRYYIGRLGSPPPSDPDTTARCGEGRVGQEYARTGAESLHFFLCGWYISDNGQVVLGDGYRIRDAGGGISSFVAFYSPVADEQSTSDAAGFRGARKGMVLLDRFAHHRPILYFKADPTAEGNPFNRLDNEELLYRWKAPGAKAFEDMVSVSGRPRSSEFLLWSAGPDGYFLNDDDILLPAP